jgi:hypothetical protein
MSVLPEGTESTMGGSGTPIKISAPLAKWLGGSLQNSGRWFDSNKVLKKLKNKFIFFLHGPMGMLT